MSQSPQVPTRTDDRLRKRVREVLSYFAAFAAICGVVLGILEYQQRQDLNRASNTMAQIEYWDGSGPREAYHALNTEVVAFFARVGERQVAEARTDLGKADNLRRETLRAVMAMPEASRQLEDVVYFFSRLSLCIEAQLCDRATAKVFFEDTLISFLSIFEPQIHTWADDRPGYGAAVLQLRDDFISGSRLEHRRSFQ